MVAVAEAVLAEKSNAINSKNTLFIAYPPLENYNSVNPLRSATISLFLNLFFSYFLPRAGRTPTTSGPFASTITDLPTPPWTRLEGIVAHRGGVVTKRQGMVIVVVVPKGPGDWKSASAWPVIASPTAGQIATRTIARHEFDVIRTRGDGANADREGSIAVDVGRDNAEFDRRYCFGHALPCDRSAGTAAAVDQKLAEGGGKRGAQGCDCDLVQLAGRRAHQGKGHRQF